MIVPEIPKPEIGTSGVDLKMVGYLSVVIMLGALSALASLLGSERVLDKRVIITYILSGGIVSLGIVLLLIDTYGFSYFLVGTAIFAGYKAFDLLAAGGVLLSKALNKTSAIYDAVTTAAPTKVEKPKKPNDDSK